MSLEPITVGEIEPEATLEDCERALHEIERNSAIQQGIVLRHIRDHRLYAPQGFRSFAEYVEKRLGYTRDWADKRIGLVNVVEQVPTNVGTPAITNEGQARAIKPVLRDHGPEVAAEVLREAADDDGKITARSITEATARVVEPEVITAEEFVETYQADVDPDLDIDALIPAQSRFERAFWQHLRSGQELVKDLDYPHHFNEQMIRMLLDLIEALHNKRDAIASPGLRVVTGGK